MIEYARIAKEGRKEAQFADSEITGDCLLSDGKEGAGVVG